MIVSRYKRDCVCVEVCSSVLRLYNLFCSGEVLEDIMCAH